MGAVALWVRSTLRRHVAVTLALAMLAGVSAGIVGFALQAARRSEGSLARYEARNRPYDVGVVGCAPGVDPASDNVDFQVVLEKCLSLEAIRQFRTDVVSKVPGVEAQSIHGVRVIGILDPTARNGWGRLILAYVSSEADPGGALASPLVVQGRRLDENNPDEVVLGETAAARAGIHVGDVVTIASWSPEELDFAIDGRVPPSTPTFTSRVVGIVRTLADVQATSEGDLRGTSLPDALFAGRAWTAAHGADLPGYRDSNMVRLASGPSGIGAFKAGLQRNASGRFFDTEPYTNPDELRALKRVIDTERQALLVFAVIAALAGVVLVGLTVGRQLRRELADSQSLAALGMSSRDLAIGGVARVAVAAVPAVVVAVLVIVLASPFAPIGIARPLEYSHPIRVDRAVLTVVPLVMVCFLLLIGAVVPLLHLSTARGTRARRAAPKPWMLARSAARLGAVPRAGLGFAGGGSPRVAVSVGGVAVGLAAAAGCLVASFDRVIDHPVRYGAWWDMAVGQYSASEPYNDAVERIRALPDVAAAAGYLEDTNTITLDGIEVPYIALAPVVGTPMPVITSGLAPTGPDEAALGAETARVLHKRIGDTVTLALPPGAPTTIKPRPLRIVGLALLANPVRSSADVAEGVVLDADLAQQFSPSGSVPQSIAIRFAPGVDQRAAIESVVAQFPGSARRALPPADLRNLERLRWVPWLIALLVAVLALGSLVHALVTLLQRHASDLAVFAALGLTRGQRRRVGVVSGLALMGLSVLIGVPGGIVLGRWIWRAVARRTSVPSGPITTWSPTLLAVMGALAVGAGVAAAAGRRVTRGSPAVQLRVE